MPHLLIFAPCQRVLHDEDKETSLISIIEGLRFGLLPNVPDPPLGTLVPMNWCTYVTWKQEPDDHDKKFEQRILFRTPDGELMMETAPQTFIFEMRMVSVITRFVNFPLAHCGVCPLTVEYRELGKEQWNDAASFPLLIEHERMSCKPPSEQTKKTVIWHNV